VGDDLSAGWVDDVEDGWRACRDEFAIDVELMDGHGAIGNYKPRRLGGPREI
jgi:hypothetical protein